MTFWRGITGSGCGVVEVAIETHTVFGEGGDPCHYTACNASHYCSILDHYAEDERAPID